MIMFKETLSLAVTLILVTACFGRGGKNDVSVLSGNGDVEVIDIDKAREEKMLNECPPKKEDILTWSSKIYFEGQVRYTDLVK